MNTVLSRSISTAVAVAAITAPLVLAGPASASGGDAVRSSGSCSGGDVFELKAKHDDGRIEVEYEVDTNRAGQAWHVRLTDDGVVVFSGTATTVAPSGSFTVRRLIGNRVGIDTIRAAATFGTPLVRRRRQAVGRSETVPSATPRSGGRPAVRARYRVIRWPG